MAALIALYHEEPVVSTLVAIANPDFRDKVKKEALKVEWIAIGNPPTSYTLLLDNQVIANDLKGTEHLLDTRKLSSGKHTLMLKANGTQTRYCLSRMGEDVPLEQPVAAEAETEFEVTD
jgi:hypothetical protein